MEVLKRVSLVDQVYEKIREKIITLEIPFGGRLNVSKFQEEYGVSSTPVREALNRLYNEGLITLENNVGANVITITANDVCEIQELEDAYVMAAARYALNKTDSDKLADEISSIILQVEENPDMQEMVGAMKKIREKFYLAACNQRLVQKSTSLNGVNEILNHLLERTPKVEMEQDKDKYGIPYLKDLEEGVRKSDYHRICNALEKYRDWSYKYIIKQIAVQ